MRSQSSSQLTRRDFLAGTAAAALSYATSGKFTRAVGAPFFALECLPLGSVKPAGWFDLYLQKQAHQLGLHLPEVAAPFTGSYWEGEEKAPSWWPWEQKGYWIDGAVRCALLSGDERLFQLANAPLDYTLRHVGPDGFLGPGLLKKGKESDGRADNFRWPHGIFFRALAAKAEVTGDTKIAEAIRKHYLNDHATYGGPSRNVTNVEAMLWSYERTGDKRLLTMAERSWTDSLKSSEPGDYESGDLHPQRVFANTPILAHGVTYAEKAKLPAILYAATGNPEYLRFALAAQKRIFTHHMLVDGVPSTSENFSGTTALDSHETCDIADHTWTWGYLLMVTADGMWGDRIERAIFNGGFGAIKKDWKALQYFSCPNQVLATRSSNHNAKEHGNHWMAYQPNPGHETACCGGNVHRIFPNYVGRMWMRDRQGGLAAVLYGPSRMEVSVGKEEQRVQIVEMTEYPFDEQIHFRVHVSEPIRFPLSFRIPGWCASPQFFLNDNRLPSPEIKNGFARLDRVFHSGDEITLVFPMRLALTPWPDDGVAIERGPLVYSLGVQENWTSVVESKWSTAEFPNWDVLPGSPWNYGWTVEQRKVESETRVESAQASTDPWINPPVRLSVPMRKIPGWALATNPENTQQHFTPILPTISDETVIGPAETMTLVPLGSTHLRVTVFPDVRKDS